MLVFMATAATTTSAAGLAPGFSATTARSHLGARRALARGALLFGCLGLLTGLFLALILVSLGIFFAAFASGGFFCRTQHAARTIQHFADRCGLGGCRLAGALTLLELFLA